LENASLFTHDCISRLHINTEREREENGFVDTPERETNERFIITPSLYVFVFIVLETNAQRKQL